MKKYKFEVTIGYEGEAETEQDFFNDVASWIENDWSEYIDDGEITEVNNGHTNS